MSVQPRCGTGNDKKKARKSKGRHGSRFFHHDGEGAESGEQQQSDEDDEGDDGACSVDLRAENSRLHRDLEAVTKERDLLRHFGPIVTQLQEDNATLTANVHAISQQLARLLDAQKAPAGAAQSSLPAPLPRPSSRPQASAQPTAGADPDLLPPPPHRVKKLNPKPSHSSSRPASSPSNPGPVHCPSPHQHPRCHP
ncbi:MAG: hypothetical protein WDW38_010763 [Sanguina aurantia]